MTTISAFDSQVFRPIMTLLAPGITAIAPWVSFLMQGHSTFHMVLRENRTESSVLFVLAALIAGMLCENFGSFIEQRFDTRRDKQTNAQHSRDWDEYLRLVWRLEPVGARYIRTILLRMKFELGMTSALLVAAVASLFLTLPIPAIYSFTAILMTSAFLFWEAYRSHRLLSKLRTNLLRGAIVLEEVPFRRVLQ